MIHVRQPTSYTCAPAVAAIITGAPIDELIAEMRPSPKRGTLHRVLIASLKARGVRCGDRFVSLRGKQWPHTAIMRTVQDAMAIGHVVVKHGDTWLDPAMYCPVLGRSLLTFTCAGAYFNGARVTSALTLEVEAS